MATFATCPAYVTGIFVMGKGDAAGAGFAIDRFMRTRVNAGKDGGISIAINGKDGAAPVSRAVLRGFSRRGFSLPPLEVEHVSDVPVGYGMGMSAAGALTLSLALNEEIGAGLRREECVRIAHDADVECKCGLSGVDAAALGGIVARQDLAAAAESIPFEGRQMEFAFFRPMRTSGVIGSEEWRGKVNAAGGKALSALFASKTLDSLLQQSRMFALESGLASWCGREMAANPRACMAMVGQTLFSDVPLTLRRKPLMLLKAKVHEGGAGIAMVV